MKAAISKALDLVLPPRCAVSGEIVDHPGMVSPESWRLLNFITDPCCIRCGAPFEVETGGEGAACAICLSDPPPFASARAALVYDDSSRGMILGFKHGDQTHAVKTFLPWLKVAGARMLTDADLMLPVPLHRWRLLYRRYNQAALMAQALARDLGKECLPDGMLRVRATPSQGHLKAKERSKNVRRAFAVNPKRAGRIAGRKIILIDDVYTTGSTVRECTRTLMEGGAAEVNVLSLARVVRPETFA